MLWFVRLVSVIGRRVRLTVAVGREAGMSTAEYAVGMIAACSFAALLYKILTSDTMQSLLRDIVSRALHITL